MIEGLYFDVSYDEMKRLVENKITYHKIKEAEHLLAFEKSEDEDDQEGRNIDRTSVPSPTKGHRQRYHHHKNRVEYFTFLYHHIVNDTYRLSEHDLLTLEFISSGRASW